MGNVDEMNREERIQRKHKTKRTEMMLKRLAKYSVLAIAMGAASGLFAGGASSEVFVQCPGDTNGNAVEDGAEAWANPN